LRFKITAVFVVPMILILSLLSYVHNNREQNELQEQIQVSTIRIGDMALSGMKNAMLRNDQEVINRIIKNYGSNPSISKIQIIGMDFQIKKSTEPNEVGASIQTTQAGCVECHQYAEADRPRVIPLNNVGQSVLRVVTLIPNDKECQSCHSIEERHLGVLIIDAPVDVISQHMQEDQIYNALISLLSLVLVTALSYMLIQWLVERRIGVLYKSLNAFAAGDFSIRVPKNWRTEDEITQLADHFNAIADTLEKNHKELREIASIRQEAIADERERIANHLHDGIAQLLAYLNAKIVTARLLLDQQNIEKAVTQMIQMEDAVRTQVNDVRAAIIGLKLMEHGGSGLSQSLKDYVLMCNRLSDLNILLDIGDGVETIRIEPEVEIQLLRIVQEALSNVRKHSSASQARITLKFENSELVLTIEDDGIGFDPWQTSLWRSPHFGLNSMGERSEKIGASFKVMSEPGKGAKIYLRLKVRGR